MMILFTSFTSSLSAAAETSSAMAAPLSSSSSSPESRSPIDSLPPGIPESAPKKWSSVSLKSRSVVTL
ncbi:hypothetical protein D3C83_247900 [compost metagenome]